MKLFSLYEKHRGRIQLLMTDSLPKVNARMAELRRSFRGGKRNGQAITFFVEPWTEDREKWEKRPANCWPKD